MSLIIFFTCMYTGMCNFYFFLFTNVFLFHYMYYLILSSLFLFVFNFAKKNHWKLCFSDHIYNSAKLHQMPPFSFQISKNFRGLYPRTPFWGSCLRNSRSCLRHEKVQIKLICPHLKVHIPKLSTAIL